MINKYQIQHTMSRPYHPQANGKVEVANKFIESIFTMTMQINCQNLVSVLPKDILAYHITWTNTTSFTPYDLVYDKNVVILIEFEVKTLRTTLQVGMDLSKAQNHHLEQINELDQIRQATLHHNFFTQQQRDKWHDKFIKKKKFQVGDWDLLFDSKF